MSVSNYRYEWNKILKTSAENIFISKIIYGIEFSITTVRNL